VIRVVIVGKPGLLRDALVSVLSNEEDFEVVIGVDAIHEDSVAGLPDRPDVVLVDIDSVGKHALSLVRRLTGHARGRVIVLTSERTPGALRLALAANVRGFVGKDLPPSELAQLIRQVHAGERVIDPVAAVAALRTLDNPLSEREREVLRAAADGLSAKETAERLFLTHGTVRNYLSSILRKTGSRNRWEAVRRAQDAGWL